ncbi:MAG: hypothetical protein MI673_07220, partial [Thiotrichales bacterium]|nr:hypothetical protein [Thiotrichales bacterium]
MSTESFITRLLPVLSVFLLGSALLALVNAMTADRISENARQRQMKMMSAVLPAASGDAMRTALFELDEPELTGAGKTLYVYRQWSDDQVDG